MKMRSSLRLDVTVLVFLSHVLSSRQLENNQNPNERLLYKWKVVEFDYPNDAVKAEAIQLGRLVPNNVLIMDADYHGATKRFFVTTPRFRKGIPATLSTVIDTGETPLLKPFPSWPKYDNDRPSCRDLFSVHRIYIDKCGLLWALDSGRDDFLNASAIVCQPKLVVYDLRNGDREVLRYEFPPGVFSDRSLLATIITESNLKGCADSVAYIADPADHGLIVYDHPKQTSWRIENGLFRPYPLDLTVIVNGIPFDAALGVFGLALDPPTERNRKLYFHSLASLRESWVPVSVLKNPTTTAAQLEAFALSPGKRASHSTVQVMTNDGILIYPLLAQNAIACWNSKMPFTIENQHIVEKNDEAFEFITGMKLKNNKLLIASNRLEKYVVGKANGTHVNYRVTMIENVKQALQSTPCDPTAITAKVGYVDVPYSSSNGGGGGGRTGGLYTKIPHLLPENAG